MYGHQARPISLVDEEAQREDPFQLIRPAPAQSAPDTAGPVKEPDTLAALTAEGLAAARGDAVPLTTIPGTGHSQPTHQTRSAEDELALLRAQASRDARHITDFVDRASAIDALFDNPDVPVADHLPEQVPNILHLFVAEGPPPIVATSTLPLRDHHAVAMDSPFETTRATRTETQ
jgi:hypothetical protein